MSLERILGFSKVGFGTMALDFGPFTLRGDTRQLLRDGREVHISPKAFDLLQLLVAERPRALSKAFLQERLWPETFVCEANLPSLVSEIRQAIGDNRRQGRFIRTVHAYGYAFCGTGKDDSVSGGREPSVATYWLSWDKVPIALRNGETLIGREPGVDIWLDVPSISRHHARIVIRDGHATVTDLGSKNGTWVRDELTRTPVSLTNGDQIRMGSVVMTFRVWAPDAITETQPPSKLRDPSGSTSASARRASSPRR
jgi:DNA-binding winged helix-turn-helix (wHTH) protein